MAEITDTHGPTARRDHPLLVGVRVGGTRSSCRDAPRACRTIRDSCPATLGPELCITDSCRSRDGQEQAPVTKPPPAAWSGTSNPGWGVPVDLCDGVQSLESVRHTWAASCVGDRGPWQVDFLEPDAAPAAPEGMP